MKWFLHFCVFVLLVFSWLGLSSSSFAQCQQDCSHTMTINGHDHRFLNVLGTPIVVVGNVAERATFTAVNTAGNVVRLSANTAANGVRFVGNVVAFPFGTYSYVRPATVYSPYFSHCQTGGTFTQRTWLPARYRR